MIEPFSQMKPENDTILDDIDSANRINFVHLRALHDALRETFLKVAKYKLLNGAETSCRRALVSNNCHLC